MSKEKLSPARIAEISEAAPVSGNKWQDLIKVYRLPENLSGKRTLDVCAGESNFCAWLLVQGAEAYAVDYFYSDFFQLRVGRVRNLLKSIGREDIDPTKSDPRVLRILDEDTAMFKRSVDIQPSSYIAASAHALPFRDKTFHLITSYYGIFGVMDNDRNLLQMAIQEAIRVLRKGGELQIAPVLIGDNLSRNQIDNQKEILNQIRKDKRLKFSSAVLESQGMQVGRAIITKK